LARCWWWFPATGRAPAAATLTEPGALFPRMLLRGATVLGELNGAVPKGSLDGYLRQHLA